VKKCHIVVEKFGSDFAKKVVTITKKTGIKQFLENSVKNHKIFKESTNSDFFAQQLIFFKRSYFFVIIIMQN